MKNNCKFIILYKIIKEQMLRFMPKNNILRAFILFLKDWIVNLQKTLNTIQISGWQK